MPLLKSWNLYTQIMGRLYTKVFSKEIHWKTNNTQDMNVKYAKKQSENDKISLMWKSIFKIYVKEYILAQILSHKLLNS